MMTDSKAEEVRHLLGQGLVLAVVAQKLGYDKATSLAQYMRRKGYWWNKKLRDYVLDGRDDEEAAAVDPEPVVETLSVEKPIARTNTVGQPVVQTNTVGQPSATGRLPVLSSEAEELLRRAGQVLALLDSGTGAMANSLSSPLLKGVMVVKSLRLPLPLVEAMEQFAKQKRLTQREVFEAALVDLMDRRGGSFSATQ